MLGTGGLEDVTHTGIIRAGVRETACGLLERAQLPRQCLELRDPFLDNADLPDEHPTHIATRRLSLVPQTQDLADIGQPDPKGPGQGHEPEPVHIAPRACAIPRYGALRLWQHTNRFVIADRRRFDTDLSSHLTDPHPISEILRHAAHPSHVIPLTSNTCCFAIIDSFAESSTGTSQSNEPTPSSHLKVKNIPQDRPISPMAPHPGNAGRRLGARWPATGSAL